MATTSAKPYRKLIHERINYMVQVRAKTDTYLERAGTIIASYNPELFERYETLSAEAIVDAVNRQLDEVESADPATRTTAAILAAGHAIYVELNRAAVAVTTAAQVFEPDTYIRAATEGLSATAVSDTYNDRDFVLDAQEWWRRREIVDDPIIVDALLTHINVRSDAVDIIEFIRAHQSVNKFTVELLRRMSAARIRSRVVAGLIDDEKNILLGAGRAEPGVHQPLVRFGLMPFTVSMPLVDIYAAMVAAEKSVAADITADTPAEEAFARLHHQVVVVDMSRPRGAIEFDSRGLISLEYLTENDLMIKRNMGLTKKVLIRYNTVREVVPAVATSLDGAARIFTIGEPTQHVFVVQILAAGQYKILSNSDTALCQRDSVRGLIDGLSERPQAYNRVCEDIIIDRVFDAAAANIHVLYAEATNLALPSDVLKADISRDFSIHFESVLNVRLPENPLQFVRVLSNEAAAVKILTRRLISHIGRPSTEFLVSYMYKFDALSRQFVREITTRAKRHQPSPLLFRELRPDELRKHIHSVFMTAIDETIDELDRTQQWDSIDKSLKEFFIERKIV